MTESTSGPDLHCKLLMPLCKLLASETSALHFGGVIDVAINSDL